MHSEQFYGLRGRLAGAAAMAALGLLQACTGGGGFDSAEDRANAGNGKPPVQQPAQPLRPSAELAQQCAAPRSGVDPSTNSPYPDQPGSVATEKAWLRSWIDETYLWYAEVPNVDAAAYATPIDYFMVLRTRATTASGALKDRFHFTSPTAEWRAESESGLGTGYGIEWNIQAGLPPRSVVVSQVGHLTPGEEAGITRGAVLLAVDGIDVVGSNDIDAINRALYPGAVNESHTFTLRDRGSQTPRTVTLVSRTVLSSPVPTVKVLPTSSGAVGYLLFNDHIATAEGGLIKAIDQLKAAQVTDLVLDMRYNGGGFLAIASQLAYMVAGPAPTSGRTFEKLLYNDKNPFGVPAGGDPLPFASKTLGFSTLFGQDLPYLGLPRVFVLTSSQTCSASESVVNSLRGIGVQVNLVGGTTCGKPYGFTPKDNCGTTYFAIQFQSVNDQGFGDYGDGFPATCAASDDFSRDLGDTGEGQLAAALALRSTGVCLPATATAQRERIAAQGTGGAELLPRKHPMRSERILLPSAAR